MTSKQTSGTIHTRDEEPTPTPIGAPLPPLSDREAWTAIGKVFVVLLFLFAVYQAYSLEKRVSAIEEYVLPPGDR